jgi:hypothetical protein
LYRLIYYAHRSQIIPICSAGAESGPQILVDTCKTAHHASLRDHKSSRVRDLVTMTQFSVLSLSSCCYGCCNSQKSPGSHRKDTPLTYTLCQNILPIIMAPETGVDQESALSRIFEGVDVSQNFLPMILRLPWAKSEVHGLQENVSEKHPRHDQTSSSLVSLLTSTLTP